MRRCARASARAVSGTSAPRFARRTSTSARWLSNADVIARAPPGRRAVSGRETLCERRASRGVFVGRRAGRQATDRRGIGAVARVRFFRLGAATRERISARRAEALTPVFDRQGRSGGGLPSAQHSFDTRAAPRRSSVRARLAAMPAVPAETLDDMLSRLDDESDLAGAPARAIPRVFSAAREATHSYARERPAVSTAFFAIDPIRSVARTRARPASAASGASPRSRRVSPLPPPRPPPPDVALRLPPRCFASHQPARRRARRSRP
jgi:hypothetical protein